MGERFSRSSSPTGDNKRLHLENARVTTSASAENRHELSLTAEARNATVSDPMYQKVQGLDALLAKVLASGSKTVYEGTGILEPQPDRWDRNSPTQLKNDLKQQTSDLEALIKDAQAIDEDYGLPDKHFQNLKDKIILAQITVQENDSKKDTIELIEKYYHLIDIEQAKNIIQPVASEVRRHIDKLKQIHTELTEIYDKSMMGEFGESDEDVSPNSPIDKGKSIAIDDLMKYDAPNVHDATDSLHTALCEPKEFKRSLLNNEVKKLENTLKPAEQTLDMGCPFGDALPQFNALQELVEKANKQLIPERENYLETIDMIQENASLMSDGGDNNWLHGSMQGVKQYMFDLESTYHGILETTELLTKDIAEYIPYDVIPRFSANWQNGRGICTIVNPIDKKFDESATIHRCEIAKKHYKKEQITDEELEQFGDLLDQKSKDMVDGTDIWHATGKEELIRILECGRFKSQFETGKSNGTYDISRRTSIELALFGYSSSAKEKRPIYGYLSKNPDGNNPKVSCYGPFRICLKRQHVEHRTTVIMHDTLYLRPEWNQLCAKPVLYTNPNKDMFPTVKALGANILVPDDNNPLEYESVDNMNNDPGSFAEIQVHGGVTKFSIDRIVAKGVTSEDLSPELYKLLKENDIDIFYV